MMDEETNEETREKNRQRLDPVNRKNRLISKQHGIDYGYWIIDEMIEEAIKNLKVDHPLTHSACSACGGEMRDHHNDCLESMVINIAKVLKVKL